MGISSYINNKTLNSNFSDILYKYDSDKNGFSQKEFSNAVYGITKFFVTNIVKLTKYDKKIFKELDINEDKTVSYDEMAIYIQKEYNLDFYSFMDMKVSEVCKAIEHQENINIEM